MKTRHVTLAVASVFGLAALAASCETKDHSLGTNSNLPAIARVAPAP
jgi:hypothetical protein